MNKPDPCYYKLPGNRCLFCGGKVNTALGRKGWSWWMRTSDRRIVGVIHDACNEPPDWQDKKIRRWAK